MSHYYYYAANVISVSMPLNANELLLPAPFPEEAGAFTACALDTVATTNQKSRFYMHFKIFSLRFLCSSEIPLADGAVNAVLCDVPFGRKFSCSSDMTSALPLLLREMERCIISAYNYLLSTNISVFGLWLYS